MFKKFPCQRKNENYFEKFIEKYYLIFVLMLYLGLCKSCSLTMGILEVLFKHQNKTQFSIWCVYN